MFEFGVLVMSLKWFGTCMCLIHEIELLTVVIWYLYYVSTCICEVWTIMCKKSWFECWIWAQEQFWIFQNLWCSLERGKRRSSGKFGLLVFLQTWTSARAGSHVVKLSARVPDFTLERENDVTSIFAGLRGPLERGSPRLSRGLLFLKFWKCILCFVFRSLSLLSILRHTLSIVNELRR